MRRILFFIVLFVSANISLNAQFHIDTLAQAPAIDFPVVIAFSPDSSHRLFFTEKNSGKVRIMQNDTLLPDPFVTVSIANAGEQGLLGITFHPQYPDSPYVYLYYTRSGDRANKVVRYTDDNNTGINPVTLLTVSRLTSTIYHNGGNIHFGPDGKLYVSVGDYAISTYPQDIANPRGKIHRINSNGTVPADNPFAGNTVFSYGHRNSFDFTFDQLNGKFYASENGPECNDEINLVVSGGNYGWPVEGNCTYTGNPMYKAPLYHWETHIPSFTGIEVYRANTFPELYGKMLVTSFNFGVIYQFDLNDSGNSIVEGPKKIFSYGSGFTDITVGPDGYLYLANGTLDGASRIMRLREPLIIPATPVLDYPPADTTNQSRGITFKWHPSPEAGYYHLKVALDSLFTSFFYDDSIFVDTSTYIGGFEFDTPYYWKVSASNGLGESEYSEPRSFRTIISPPVPILQYPEDDTIFSTFTANFQWRSSELSSSYEIEISKDSLFSSIVIDTANVIDTSFTFVSLQNYTTYYWRVRASNIGGPGNYSDFWKFSVIRPDTFFYNIKKGWNLLSTPLITEVKLKTQIFPGASSNAFAFSLDSGYVVHDSLKTLTGYWVKFDSEETFQISGELLQNDTIELFEGWNLIGAMSDTIFTSSLQSLPENSIISNYFGYDRGYISSEFIAPGQGYWVKSSSAGKLFVSSVLQKKKILQFIKMK